MQRAIRFTCLLPNLIWYQNIYIPKNDTNVKINRLGSGEWKKTKAKVRSSVKDMAKELIALYAKRMSTKGFAFF